MSQRETPFLRLLAPLALGIVAAGSCDLDFGQKIYWLLALLFPTLGWLAHKKYALGQRWIFGPTLILSLFTLGICRTKQQDERHDPCHFAQKIRAKNWVVATLNDDATHGQKLRLTAKIEAIGSHPDSLKTATGNLQIYLENTPETAQLRYGDQVLLAAQLREIDPPKNPNAFDYRRYLHFQNIHFQAFVKTDSFQILARDRGNPLWQWAYQNSQNLLNLLRKHFPSQDEYAAASALLIGTKDELSDELRQAYTQTGSMHALAVSGTHVSFIFIGLLFLLRRVPMPLKLARWLEPAAALALIWAFTFVTGATASVVRAAVMFSLYLIGKALWRNASTWNILAASAFGQLLVNPFWLFDVGFQLSYAAVAGMVWFYPRFRKISPDFASPIARYFWGTLLVGIAATLGTLPLTVYYFHQFPVYFWLSGWLVVGGGAVFLYGSFFLALLANWLPSAATMLGKALFGLVWAMNHTIFFIQKLPGALVQNLWLAGWATTVLYLTLVAFSAAAETQKPRWLLAGLALLTAVGIGHAVHKISNWRERNVLIYSTSRHTLLDFSDGQTCLALADSIPEKAARFAADNHRAAAGIGPPSRQFLLGKDTAVVLENFFWQPPLAQFFRKKLAVVDDEKWAKTSDQTAPVQVDAVLLCQNPKVKIEELAARFRTTVFVADASNSFSRIRGWKKACAALNLEFHDLREEGALFLKIE